MSGYPHNPSGYGYGQPPPSQPYSSAPYGGAPPPSSGPYGVVPQHGHSSPYGSSDPNKPSKDHHTQPPSSATYGGTPPPSSTAYGGAPPPSAPSYGGTPPHGYSAPYGSSDPSKPPKDHHTPPPSSGPYGGASGYAAPPQPHSGPYNPFSSLTPSIFPPGTDPNVIACFQMADQDGSGFIDDKELQKALSSYNQSFGLRTVHLLMYLFTNTNIRKIGPKEFSAVFYSLQNWREIFERFDKDRSGKIDSSELRDALHSLGYAVYGPVLELLVSKFDKTGGMNKAIEYDNFIECCLTVKGLTEKFKEKDTKYSGSATFTYESFMLTILPFLIA